jgi:hypothetical protein
VKLRRRIESKHKYWSVVAQGDFAAEHPFGLPVFVITASETQFVAEISKAIGTDPLVCLVCGLSIDTH